MLVSADKDSLCMLLMLIEKQYPLDEVVFYDTGKEFQTIYNLRDRMKPLLKDKGIKFTELLPPKPFDYMMFDHKTKSGKTGYGWCGGRCRWGTTYKISALDKVGDKSDIRYIGVAIDEPNRYIMKIDHYNDKVSFVDKRGNPFKRYPLAEWNMTEKDCLEYCYSKGYSWDENGVELYSILDRVSCWCCRNKNLKELKKMYQYLPEYWEKLKDIQRKLPDPMKGEGKSVFELEERFRKEIEKAN